MAFLRSLFRGRLLASPIGLAGSCNSVACRARSSKRDQAWPDMKEAARNPRVVPAPPRIRTNCKMQNAQRDGGFGFVGEKGGGCLGPGETGTSFVCFLSLKRKKRATRSTRPARPVRTMSILLKGRLLAFPFQSPPPK